MPNGHMDLPAPLRLGVAASAALFSFHSGAALSTPNGKPAMSASGRGCADCHGSLEHRRIVISGDALTEIRFDAAMMRFAEALPVQAELRPAQAWPAAPAGDGAADLAGPPSAPARDESPRAEPGPDSAALAPGWPFALLLALAWLVRRRA
jgi:uncharacterized protein (TIGR03382 family)